MDGDARDRGDRGDGTRTVLVAGTASHVGKSTVVAGLCRRLADRGVSVAPFKAQNMSNNARAVLRPDGEWGEVGVSQYVQARAAGVTPTTDHNPVLLKPTGGGESQLVVDGQAVADVAAGAYYEDHWDRARAAAREAYERLAATHDVVVCEGAGSIAEINLHDRDLSNVETARFGSADVLVLGDIERGGVFASLYGTLELLPDDLRARVVGTAITKFRGDESLLGPGIERLEELTEVPVLDVLPYEDPGLPEEDSLSLPTVGDRGRLGTADDVPENRAVVVGVPRLPHVSNVADFDALAAEPGVRVDYLPLEADLAGVDALVLPGSKNTVDDLLALRGAGFGERLRAFGGPVVGICAGYQMLGERLTGADREGTGDPEVVEGFGLLPVETEFLAEKRVEQTTREVDGCGPIRGATGTVSGYEIHTGRTRAVGDVARPLGPDSAAVGDVVGTYLHGLFDGATVREAFVDRVFESAGRERPTTEATASDPYERAAELVAGLDRSLFEP